MFYILIPYPILRMLKKNPSVLITILGAIITLRDVKAPLWDWIGWKEKEPGSPRIHILCKCVHLCCEMRKERKKSCRIIFLCPTGYHFIIFILRCHLISIPNRGAHSFLLLTQKTISADRLITFSKVRICRNSAFCSSFVISVGSL